MNELQNLYTTLKVVGQSALEEALLTFKTYIDRRDSLLNGEATHAIAVVQGKLDALIGAAGGDADKILNTFNEIKAFLADYDEDDTLKSLIDAASTAAQNAADAAEAAAKSYADGKVGTEKTRAEGAESALSTRIANLEGIDVMTQEEANKICDDLLYPFVAVDLGLPSGTLWADHNLGASMQQDFGKYFSWGNTTGVELDDASELTAAAYSGTNGASLSGDITQGGFNDAAAAAGPSGGFGWVMPTYQQWEELINPEYTTIGSDTVGGVNGVRITSKTNGKSIFLPDMGWISDGEASSQGETAKYWTTHYGNNSAYCITMALTPGFGDEPRSDGYGIRPVQNGVSDDNELQNGDATEGVETDEDNG